MLPLSLNIFSLSRSPSFLSLDLFPFEFSPTSIVFLSLLVGGYCSEFTSHSSPGRWSSRSDIDLPRWHPQNPSQVSYFIRIVEKLKDIAPFCSKGTGAICFVENWKLRVERYDAFTQINFFYDETFRIYKFEYFILEAKFFQMKRRRITCINWWDILLQEKKLLTRIEIFDN